MLVLCPLILINRKQLSAVAGPTIFAPVMIRLAFSLYANGLLETTVVRTTLLYDMNLVWSPLIGVLWVLQRLTKAQVISIIVVFFGLMLLYLAMVWRKLLSIQATCSEFSLVSAGRLKLPR